ncbi:hypothetical protein INT44_002135 [Umbelopsis vinacea]|uniref:Uncharacterized protein n=1 Tax=Umbelopsis vinacea TaxID=44442 RepID=A0A8H7UJE6_9FUNG|nr:hypothetical protein INT44_002135 [Umbelopsis vinacea]
MTIRAPILVSAAHICFNQCASWIILCGGVGLAASIIEHNRTSLATTENHTMASGNSFIKIIQSEAQQSLLERLSPRHHVQKGTTRPKETMQAIKEGNLAVTAPQGVFWRQCRLQKIYKSRSKHQPDRWIDAIDSEKYVNPHLMGSLQSNHGSMQNDKAMIQNLVTLLLLVHTGIWNLSLSYMQLTAVVY